MADYSRTRRITASADATNGRAFCVIAALMFFMMSLWVLLMRHIPMETFPLRPAQLIPRTHTTPLPTMALSAPSKQSSVPDVKFQHVWKVPQVGAKSISGGGLAEIFRRFIDGRRNSTVIQKPNNDGRVHDMARRWPASLAGDAFQTLPVTPLNRNAALPASCEQINSSAYRQIVSTVATNDTTLANFECGRVSYYFFVISCLAPLAGLLPHAVQAAQTRPMVVYTNPFMRPYWQLFHSAFVRAGVEYSLVYDSTRFPQSANASVFAARVEVARPGKTPIFVGGECARDLFAHAVGISAQPQECDSIVVVRRLLTRRIIDEQDLIQALRPIAHLYKLDVVSFFGNETAADMVRIFGKACAVVGFHGAGQANAIFSPRGTLVLEITTYKSPVDTVSLWRSNRQDVMECAGNALEWEIYVVPYSHLRPLPIEAKYNASEPRVWDLSIMTKSAVLGPEHRMQVANRVQAYLEHRRQ